MPASWYTDVLFYLHGINIALGVICLILVVGLIAQDQRERRIIALLEDEEEDEDQPRAD